MSEEIARFTWASCELSGYKMGYITVKLDFTTNVLTWKDSNHWYNNFVRGLPKAQMQPIYEAIESFVREHRHREIAIPDSPEPYVWHIQIGDANDSQEFQGYDVKSESWLHLVNCIESVVDREFRL